MKTKVEEKKYERMPFYRKILFGVGDSTFSTLFTVVAFLYMFFLTDVVGLKPSLAGAVLLILKGWDAVTDPMVGYLSDRTKSRWGRRRPYMLFGIFPCAFFFALIWQTYPMIPIDNQTFLFITYALLNLVFWTFFTIAGIPYASLAPELTLDYDDRTSLISARMFFSIVFGLLAAVVPFMILDLYPNKETGFGMMGIFIGIFAIFPVLISFFGTKERPEFQEQKSLPFITSVKETLKNKPFRVAMTIFLLSWMTVDIIGAVFIYYVIYCIGYTESVLQILFGTMFITAMLFLPFWVFVSKKIGKRMTYICGMAFWAAVMFLLFILPPGTPFLALVVLSFLAGIGVSTAHLIPWAMIIDCVDFDELNTGARREGMFTGFTLFLQKFASAIALFVIGIFLDYFGYVANMLQTKKAIIAIKLLIGPIPAMLLLSSIIVSLFYPITKEKYREIREILDKKEKGAGA
ncbi:MAG: MFS transporter [Deltaproteobacteria bacterium]|uniref:MFS transporter n=1 Tax=Candidatus Zymogenus saltonus TaxID=2844893 RepID=A0A9D8KF60_9DELT|nr:MFS transporter [Candidatus Zymogenus saltonus]